MRTGKMFSAMPISSIVVNNFLPYVVVFRLSDVEV